MRKILFLLTVALSSTLTAQESIDIIDYANEWEMYRDGTIVKYVLQKESEIDGVKYRNLANEYKYCYRQEGDKVYRYTKSDGKEQVILDFGLEVGDVFPLYEGLSLQVEQVSDTLIAYGWVSEALCKCIHLRGVEDPTFQDMWVEGFGSVCYGITPPEKLEDLFKTHLLYAISEGYIYMTNFSSDNLWGLEAPLGEEYPDSDVEEPLEFTLYDNVLHISGYIWNDCDGPLYLLVKEKDDNIFISRFELPGDADCYSYFKTDFSIRGLDLDKYTINYRNRTYEVTKTSKPYLITDGLQWAKCCHYHTGEYTTVAYELRGDTIIGGESYKKEWQTSHEDLTPMELTGCFMREEAGKVYRKRGDSDEYLWFDYLANVGDSIFYDHSFAVVTGHSDTTIVCNGTSRTYNGVDIQVGSYADSDDGHLIPGCVATFYEGLGLFTNGDIASDPSFLTTGSRTELLWLKRDGALLYLNEEGVFWKDNTSIEDIESLPNDTPYYDLQGRPVANPTRGIYIKDGRKVAIK